MRGALGRKQKAPSRTGLRATHGNEDETLRLLEERIDQPWDIPYGQRLDAVDTDHSIDAFLLALPGKPLQEADAPFGVETKASGPLFAVATHVR